MGSGIKGNWSVTQRDDGTGGNLEVAETMKAKTLVVEETAVFPGVVIDNHVHDANAIISGTIDPERLPTKEGGGVEAVEGGIQLAVPTVKALLGLGSAAYTGQDSYSSADHQHAVVPVTGVPANGIISIAENQQQYRCVVTGNTVLGFDATGVQGAGNSVTFELVLTMGSRVYPVLFGPTIAWLDGDEPLFNLPNTTYLIAFRSYDGGETWIGAYQGCY